MIKIELKICIFITVILVSLSLLLVFFYYKTKPKKTHDMNKKYYKDRKKVFSRLKINTDSTQYKFLDNYLNESGYIFTPISYLFLHSIALLVILYSILSLGFDKASKMIIPVILMIIGLINMVIYKKSSDRKNKIRLELCNIQDVMYFQNKIGTSEDITLTYAAKIANEPLKEPLEYLAIAPKVKKSVDNALEELRSVSNIVELQSFSFILQQKKETGNVLDNYKAQAQMMKRSKRLRRKINRQYKRTKLVIASLMLFGCYVLLLTVPLITEALRSLDLMLR